MGGGLPSGTPGKKQIDKATKATRKVATEVFEETIEKPVKKIGKETFDVVAGTTDEERRAMLGGAPTPEPEVTPEVTPETVPDETLIASKERRRSAGKRSGGAGTILEEYGVKYSKPSSKSVTGVSV
tara:strand:- start:75 stop:455 length:381 start_codon:yes stop_codon:yes gene_type:complete